MKASDVVLELKRSANAKRAHLLQKYFKTYEGGYAYGDKFLGGLTVPEQRIVARKYVSLDFGEIEKLLESEYHECRFTALEVLVMKFESSDEKGKRKISGFYLKHRKYINNWDLVDTSAPYILGEWIAGTDRRVLYRLAKSKSFWDRRIAVVSTFAFLKRGDVDDSYKIAEMMLGDKHDLIHKAVGWMLREAGKKDTSRLEAFLGKYGSRMPRTMLRYALEKFPEAKRRKYMALKPGSK